MHWGFVITGYVITFTGLALYAGLVIARGRRLSKQVPDDKRWFLD